uniref:uncharacterized protein LOC106993634 isoform X2 n=1 Tax=Macaca mulatta TaxID=9544 RepID=UPI0010A26DC4|nr:uncharacterized protein LOC106993634 isoform X2 [Macaca mulatta]
MALSQVPGLRVLELLSIKDEDDLDHTAAGWRNVTQRRGFRLRGARGDPKGEGRASAVSAPGWAASPPAGEFVPSSSRISPSIAPLGPQREAARPGGGLKSAFCSLPGPQSHSTLSAAVWAAGSAGRAQGQRSPRVCAGAGRGSRARSDFCGPWLPSRGREAPWYGCFRAAEGRWPGGCGSGPASRGGQPSAVFFQSLWNVFPLVRGLKISHEKHHCALAEVLAGCSIIPLLCPKKPPHIPSGCRPLDFSV